MSKKKFKKGAPVTSVNDFLKHDWFIVCGKTYNAGWCRAWSLNLAQSYIKDAFVAERLTNNEFYAGKTDDQLMEIVGEKKLCSYCDIPIGVRRSPDEFYDCDKYFCKDALKTWKEERVE